ncbi:hypothetical protein HGE68_01170 [Rhodobacteraceae bacterium R_SAG6]|nr:hypothetical protein [Rhodobacteraceae bacterium R_SAG6]
MRSDQSASGDALLISTKELSEFLDVTETFARKLMKSLDIPKRRKGYPKLRLFAAFGFEAPFPIHAPDIWLSLLDVPAAAKATGEGEKTIGRMFEGSHKDKSFTNYLFLGPRKRVIFPFEAEAWLSGLQPEFVRRKALMHPYLRGEKTSEPSTNNHKHEPAPMGTRSSATALFLPPYSEV